MKQTENEVELDGIFPVPIYRAYRDSDLDTTEKREIKEVVNEQVKKEDDQSTGQVRRFTPSNNTYIFNTKLKKLKEFCERHIDIYVKEIIATKEKELDFYITQSWLNITKPGESLRQHNHSNSIISGAFYIATEEDDAIMFTDPNVKIKTLISLETEFFSVWNSSTWSYPVRNNLLILFPAWLDHGVTQNLNATRDRISLAFNVFVKGSIGMQGRLSELVLR